MLPQIPREGGDWHAREHFSYVPTAPKASWHGYIAGPTLWFWCHQPKKTKPCLAILTNRAVECPWCGTDKPVVYRGYVPLYRQSDWMPRCVIVNEVFKEVTDKFALHDRVTLGKEGEDSDPVWIMRAMVQTPTFCTTLKHRHQPVDVSESLLKIWGNAELRKWADEQSKKQSDIAMSLTQGVAVDDKGKPVDPLYQAAAKRQGFPVSTDPQVMAKHRDQLAELQAHASKNGTLKNGKHKPKPGDGTDV